MTPQSMHSTKPPGLAGMCLFGLVSFGALWALYMAWNLVICFLTPRSGPSLAFLTCCAAFGALILTGFYSRGRVPLRSSSQSPSWGAASMNLVSVLSIGGGMAITFGIHALRWI